MITHELLTRLWDSTASLFERFSVKQTPEQALANVLEEIHEFLLASTDDNRAEEAADVIVTVMGWCMALALPDKQGRNDFIADVRLKAKRTTPYNDIIDLMDFRGWEMPIELMLAYTTAEHIERVIAKNDAKTSKTHYVNADGKIARRVAPLAINPDFLS